MSALAPTLEAWFTERLIGQRHVSPNTISAYRDAWRLLLSFVQQQTGTEPSRLDIADLGAECISSFLDHLEKDRHNSVRTCHLPVPRDHPVASNMGPPRAHRSRRS